MRKNFLYKVTALSLSVVLLSGCGFNDDDEKPTRKPRETSTEKATDKPNKPDDTNTSSNSDMYSFSLYDEDRQYTAKELQVQEDFYEYLEQSFIDIMKESYINSLYTVADAEALGITYDTISWGKVSIEDMQNNKADILEAIDELHAFDYDSLNYEGKLIYDTLDEYLNNNLSVADYWYFDEAFSPLTGLQSNIPILLAEIEFDDIDDIKNYILLLDDTDRYISDILDYEKYRAEHYEIFLSDDGADEVIEQCREFIDADDNVLISSFKERLDSASFLSDSEKTDFIEQNDDIVTDSILPAFENICTTINDLKGSRAHDSLSEYEGGAEYYRFLCEKNSGYTIFSDSYTPVINSGSDLFCMSMDDFIDLTDEYVSDALQAIIRIASTDYNSYAEAMDPNYPVSDPTETINYFIKKIKKDFPASATTSFEVKYVPESLEASSSPAFYFTAPIDNINKNIIYINGGSDFANENLYATLSHEGVPGHMYQHTYFCNLNPAHIRGAIDFIAYTEGFAMYAENYAFDYSGLDKNVKTILKANNITGYGLYSYIDLQVNVNGWDLDDVKSYMTDSGFAASYAPELYQIALNSPTIYHRYFSGLMAMNELQEYAMDVFSDNYTNKNFNKFLLEVGPTFFEIIQKKLDEFAPRLDN